MRTAFLHSLTQLMKEHEDIMVLTSDMGFSVFENIEVDFADRFINTGVTEQSTASIAAGLALSGYKVYFYAQAPFATMRCFEQIRLDIDSHNLNVKIIGAAAGFYSNQLGVSHFALEDVGLMRMLPNMTILTPGDPKEAEWATNISYDINGPVYIRLTKSGSEVIHKEKLNLSVGDTIQLKKGDNCSIFVSGSMLPLSVKVYDLLRAKGISSSLVSFPTIKPLNTKAVMKAAEKSPIIFTIEDHYKTGGLGSAVAEVLAESGSSTKLCRVGVPNKYTKVAGSLDYLMDYNDLSVDKIVKTITQELKGLKNK